jgi:FMN-dependent NADH-azoreductase
MRPDAPSLRFAEERATAAGSMEEDTLSTYRDGHTNDGRRLLHIVATPRAEMSRTLRVSRAFLDTLAFVAPDATIDTLDLFADDLPKVAGGNIEVKYGLMAGAPPSESHAESWAQIEGLIERFMTADIFLISVPMWNLSIPYALKYFIDAIVQPGYLFRYDDHGMVEGMCHNKKMIVITSRGGDYSAGSPFEAHDFMEPYLRAIFGFVGIVDIEFVYAQPVDVELVREEAMNQALDDAAAAAHRLAGSLVPAMANSTPAFVLTS